MPTASRMLAASPSGPLQGSSFHRGLQDRPHPGGRTPDGPATARRTRQRRCPAPAVRLHVRRSPRLHAVGERRRVSARSRHRRRTGACAHRYVRLPDRACAAGAGRRREARSKGRSRGRSMVDNVNMAVANGYIDAPPGALVDLQTLSALPHHQQVIVLTGAQGEPLSVLSGSPTTPTATSRSTRATRSSYPQRRYRATKRSSPPWWTT